MKKMNLGQADAIMILTAAEMNLKPAFVDQARAVLEKKPVHITMNAQMNTEAVRMNGLLRHDANLIAQANVIAQRIAAEHGFGPTPETDTEQETETADAPR